MPEVRQARRTQKPVYNNWKLRSGNFMVAIFLCYSTLPGTRYCNSTYSSTTTRYDDSCWLTQVLACRCGCCFKQRGKRRDDGARGRPLPTGPKGASAAAKACDCGYACCGCGVGLDAAAYPASLSSAHDHDVVAHAEGLDPRRVHGPVPLDHRAVLLAAAAHPCQAAKVQGQSGSPRLPSQTGILPALPCWRQGDGRGRPSRTARIHLLQASGRDHRRNPGDGVVHHAAARVPVAEAAVPCSSSYHSRSHSPVAFLHELLDSLSNLEL